MTLISTIKDSLDAVDWSALDASTDPYVHIMLYYGALLGQYTIADFEDPLDYYLDQNPLTWYKGTEIIQAAELLGLTSSKFTAFIKQALSSYFTFLTPKHLPATYTSGGHSYFMCYRCHIALMYRYAKQLKYETDSWNSQAAWAETAAVLTAVGHGALAIDPRDDSYVIGNNRFYDENAEFLEWLVSLYDLDRTRNAGALTYALSTMWEYIQTQFWSTTYYTYSAGMPGFECEGPFFSIVMARARAINDYELDYWDRVITDLETRFLASDWNSPQWTYVNGGTTNYYAVVHHHTDTDQSRLENTIAAWVALHAFYQLMDAANKTAMQTLLDDTTKAWEHFIASSELYDSVSKLFTDANDRGSYLNCFTPPGILLLFLLGIVPQTGSLYVPLFETSYEGGFAFLFNDYWLFDYDHSKIRIPVKAGSIKFIYGESSVTETFPEDGIYEITFSDDWNYISDVVKIKDLNPDLYYVAEVTTTITKAEAAFNRAFKSLLQEVTLRKLSLGIMDDVTGWFVKDYSNSTVNMAVYPRAKQQEALAAGVYVRYDGVGLTTATVREGDQILTADGEYYEVKTVEKHMIQSRLKCNVCDLVILPLENLTAKSYTASTFEDDRYRNKEFLDAYLDVDYLPIFITAYGKPDYLLTRVYSDKSIDAVFSLGTPETEALPMGIGYIANVPITISTVDKTNASGTKLRWQCETQLRKVFEDHPTGSLRSFDRISDSEEKMGSVTVYSVTYMARYKRYVS